VVLRTFSPARAWRPAVVARLARTLGIARMANPRLTKDQRADLFAPLFDLVRNELDRLSAGDPELLWALRRKLAKELTYLERSTPSERGKLKALVFQSGARQGSCRLGHAANG
jgi:hypothetical protein